MEKSGNKTGKNALSREIQFGSKVKKNVPSGSNKNGLVCFCSPKNGHGSPKLSTGVFLVPFKTYFAGGLYGRYYFDVSRRRDYPAFFLHVGASFHSRTDDLGRANYGGAEVLIGQTFRRTREPLTYREITQDIGGFLRSGKWPRNGYRGRWGLEYSMGASISYGPASRKSVVSPQLQIGVSYYFDSKGWTRRP